jgi:hypothetical protein
MNTATIMGSPMTLKCEDIDTTRVVDINPEIYNQGVCQCQQQNTGITFDENYHPPMQFQQHVPYEYENQFRRNQSGPEENISKRDDFSQIPDDISMFRNSIANQYRQSLSNESNLYFRIGSTESSKEEYLNNPFFAPKIGQHEISPKIIYQINNPVQVNQGVYYTPNQNTNECFVDNNKNIAHGVGSGVYVLPSYKLYPGYSNESIKSDLAYPTESSIRMGSFVPVNEVPIGEYYMEADHDVNYPRN